MRYRLSLLLCCICLFGCAETVVDDIQVNPATKRITPSGLVTGLVTTNGAHVWRGLPFAHPPTGELRWRAPRPLLNWGGDRDALKFASACAQATSQLSEGQGNKIAGNEDCLYLNIYAPPMSSSEAANANLPVMVWIHGGGNSVGSASRYDASILAVQENVVVITVQYRLGPFGWFHHPSLSAFEDSKEDQSGNYGTLDLIESLGWAKRNISAYGGNPKNLTIFGESAGGYNVFSLLLSPLAKGLFQRAISQSGRAEFSEFGEGGENSSLAATQRMLQISEIDDAKQLRNLTASQVLEAYRSDPGHGMIDLPTVFHDGYVLPTQSASVSFANGNYNKVPTILGSNRDEQKLFQFMSSKYTTKWLGLWLKAKDKNAYSRDASYKTKHWRLLGVEEPARQMSQSPVYAYRFDWDDLGNTLGTDFSFLLGAAHAFEIPFIFGGLGLKSFAEKLDTTPRPDQRIELSNAMMSYWSNFARTGNPNNPALPEWRAWNQQEAYIVFDAQQDGGIRMSDDTLKPKALVKQLAVDALFENDRQRCELLFEILETSSLLANHAENLACE